MLRARSGEFTSCSTSELELVEQQGVLNMTVLDIPYWVDILVYIGKGLRVMSHIEAVGLYSLCHIGFLVRGPVLPQRNKGRRRSCDTIKVPSFTIS